MIVNNQPEKDTARVNVNVLAAVEGDVVPLQTQLGHVHEEAASHCLAHCLHVATRADLHTYSKPG